MSPNVILSQKKKYFTETGPNLAKKIKKSRKSFVQYFRKYECELFEHLLSISELKDAFSALKSKQKCGV